MKLGNFLFHHLVTLSMSYPISTKELPCSDPSHPLLVDVLTLIRVSFEGSATDPEPTLDSLEQITDFAVLACRIFRCLELFQRLLYELVPKFALFNDFGRARVCSRISKSIKVFYDS